jgi:hypothetical protein
LPRKNREKSLWADRMLIAGLSPRSTTPASKAGVERKVPKAG